MHRQLFSSYLCTIGNFPDKQVLSWLPGLNNGEHAKHNDTHMYWRTAQGSRLHKIHISVVSEFVLFISGEFYQETELKGLETVITDNDVNEKLLKQYLLSLNGVFSGFIINTLNEKSWLFTDRFGFGHIYYADINGKRSICSHIWPLIQMETSSGDYDYESMRHILTSGFPLNDKTAFNNIKLVLPGTCTILSDKGKKHITYHELPDEREHIGLEESSSRLYSAFNDHFTYMRESFDNNEYGLSMSGGHDSRVVLNAMIQSGISPTCISGYSGGMSGDAKRAVSASRAAGCQCEAFDYSISDERDIADTKVIVDGAGSGAITMNLSRVANDNGAAILYFGTTGDVLSGGWHFNPAKCQTEGELASDYFKAYNYEYSVSFNEFSKIFRNLEPNKIFTEFYDDFDNNSGSNINKYLKYRLQHRNFRRIRMFMQGAYLYSTPVHLFHDSRIADVYNSVPVKYLKNQVLHNQACFYAKSSLGMIPTSNYQIPVKYETLLMPLVRRMTPKILHGILLGKRKNKTFSPDADNLEILRDSDFGAQIDFNKLIKVISSDEKGGLLALRCGYIANMLNPEIISDKSRYLGNETFIHRDL